MAISAAALAGGALLSSSSLSDPPEELLSEAMSGAFPPSAADGEPQEVLTAAVAQTHTPTGQHSNFGYVFSSITLS